MLITIIDSTENVFEFKWMCIRNIWSDYLIFFNWMNLELYWTQQQIYAAKKYIKECFIEWKKHIQIEKWNPIIFRSF